MIVTIITGKVKTIHIKFDIFREPQLNTYFKGMQKKVFKKLQKLYLLKT